VTFVSQVYRDSSARLQAVIAMESNFDNVRQRVGLFACKGGDDTACRELLLSTGVPSLPRPLAMEARYYLVALALRHGGRDAYHRLVVTANQPIPDRLAAAASMPIDMLVREWRDSVLASRPKPVSLPPGGAWLALGWIGLFLTCGCRSSRWRVG